MVAGWPLVFSVVSFPESPLFLNKYVIFVNSLNPVIKERLSSTNSEKSSLKQRTENNSHGEFHGF